MPQWTLINSVLVSTDSEVQYTAWQANEPNVALIYNPSAARIDTKKVSCGIIFICNPIVWENAKISVWFCKYMYNKQKYKM